MAATPATKIRPQKAPSPETEALRNLIVQGMRDRKAQEIAILDLRKVKNAFCDYFIICSGTSDTQVDSICDSIEEAVWKETRLNAAHKEGKENREWILLDYSDIVAHVFKKERRQFYALEDLWGDAEITYLDED